MKRSLPTILILAGIFSCSPGTVRGQQPADNIDFSRDIRPIFSDICFKCHGPDANQRQAELRLDREESVRKPRDGRALLAAGHPELSELYLRISADDPDVRMPPPAQERQLTQKQIDSIKRWIEQGANWKSHWSFETPRRPKIPKVSQQDWPRNEIDSFILNRLDREGLQPSAPADKRTLIRRVSLDLTGLPPTPEEVEKFLSDQSPDAYERVVDRLLASSRYGERMAGDWLDAARYADTSGYQNDGPREMWRWRDWVIDAFNANKPFDEFTIEQLAGDLLPHATLAQKIATGFNRNHRGNAEGGIIPEEFQVEYVVDRVETTSTVWLGLSLGCARCHDHKYDPFTQREFYRLFALFNNIPEHGRSIKEGNSPPYIKAPTKEQQQQLTELDKRLAELIQQTRQLEPRLLASLKEWESKKTTNEEVDWQPDFGLLAAYSFDDEAPQFVEGEPSFHTRERGRAVALNGTAHLDMGDVANFGYFDKFSFSCWIKPDSVERGTILSRMEDVPQGSGYSVRLSGGKIEVDLVKRWLDDSVRVETGAPVIEPGKWSHIAVTYDGSRVASGIRVFVDGQPVPLKVNLDYINQSFNVDDAPLRLGAGHGPQDRYRGQLDNVRIYARTLTENEVSLLSESDSITGILQIPSAKRTPRQAHKLRNWYLVTQAPEAIRSVFEDRDNVTRKRASFYELIPTVMVMQERKERRPTYLLKRGEYDKPGDEVSPGVPASIDVTGKPIDDRLALARWLVDERNPLTARVGVNRLWQQLFGTGLVKTSEDFGSQGEQPSHPELLDWLATELIRLDWDVKALQKLIVMSATYRQSSKISQELLERDPENRLLARGSRVRLSARMLRDQALYVSGLLHEQLHGPSVKPYQPEGLWKEIATTTEYDQSTGTDLYRRSLYTYWKRTVAPPSMALFDAAGREMCVVRSSRTNTPLQALALMNEVTMLESARALAERTFHEVDGNVTDRIRRAFLLATARSPDSGELKLLTDAYARYHKNYKQHPKDAEKMISHGDSKPDPKLDRVDLATMTVIAAMLFNLDEVITKE